MLPHGIRYKEVIYMDTSSIFKNIVIEDPKEIETFITALESSEKAAKTIKLQKNSGISVLWDTDSIHRFIENMKV